MILQISLLLRAAFINLCNAVRVKRSNILLSNMFTVIGCKHIVMARILFEEAQ